MGGEKLFFQDVINLVEGSPPHGRGKAAFRSILESVLGITPAWAGKRKMSAAFTPGAGDHPRMGGEKTKKIP